LWNNLKVDRSDIVHFWSMEMRYYSPVLGTESLQGIWALNYTAKTARVVSLDF
jgi:hypothetical protein